MEQNKIYQYDGITEYKKSQKIKSNYDNATGQKKIKAKKILKWNDNKIITPTETPLEKVLDEKLSELQQNILHPPIYLTKQKSGIDKILVRCCLKYSQEIHFNTAEEIDLYHANNPYFMEDLKQRLIEKVFLYMAEKAEINEVETQEELINGK